MIYRLPAKRGSIELNTDDGIYVEEPGMEVAAGYLMRLTLNSQASVVAFSKKPDFYRYVNAVDIAFVLYLTAGALFDEIPYPYFRKFKGESLHTMKEIMEEAGQGRDLVHLKGKTKDKPYLMPPNVAHTFCQIADKGSKKDRVLIEALFGALIADSLTERMRQTVFFYEAPIKPYTKKALNAIKRADEAGVALIGMYKDKAPVNAGRYGITCKDNILKVSDRTKRRSYKVEVC